MAQLSTDRQAQVLNALVEGVSIRATERLTGVHRDTIIKLANRVGRKCERMMAEEIRGVRCNHLQLDELWTFVGKKRNHVRRTDDAEQVGDFWTWVAIDPETKLVPGYHVGKRGLLDAYAFMRGLRKRVEGRCQLSSDKLNAYRSAIYGIWSEDAPDGRWVRPDWGTIVKRYSVEPSHDGRYSPPECVGVDRTVECGNPDPEKISTSHVERNHLTVRMQCRRFTRLTNGFSKKVENLKAAVALHFAHYNFVRVHSTIKTTPAIAAGLASRRWRLEELLELVG